MPLPAKALVLSRDLDALAKDNPEARTIPALVAERQVSASHLCLQLKSANVFELPHPELGKDIGDTRSLENLVQHVQTDCLVRWAWKPGPGRSRAPGEHHHLVACMQVWADSQGPCPQE